MSGVVSNEFSKPRHEGGQRLTTHIPGLQFSVFNFPFSVFRSETTRRREPTLCDASVRLPSHRSAPGDERRTPTGITPIGQEVFQRNRKSKPWHRSRTVLSSLQTSIFRALTIRTGGSGRRPNWKRPGSEPHNSQEPAQDPGWEIAPRPSKRGVRESETGPTESDWS